MSPSRNMNFKIIRRKRQRRNPRNKKMYFKLFIFLGMFFLVCSFFYATNTNNVKKNILSSCATEESRENKNSQSEGGTQTEVSVNTQKLEDLESTLVNEAANSITGLEQTEVDCVFSAGYHCRPAYYLRRHGLRFMSSPLDWQMKYSLDSAAHLFETKFKDFFEEIEILPDKPVNGHIFVRDKKTAMVDMHHYKADAPIEQEHQRVQEIMHRRAAELDGILSASSSIGLISTRTEKEASNEDVVNFVKRIGATYPNKSIAFINVRSEKEAKWKYEVLHNEGGLKAILITVDDYATKSSDSWQGNPQVWEKIINQFKLTNMFADRNKQVTD